MLFYSSLKFYTIFVNDLKGAKNAFLSLCIVRDLLSKERIITDFTSCSLNSTAPLQTNNIKMISYHHGKFKTHFSIAMLF